MERVRVDRWLWAVRLTKTRSGAAQACRAGHVQVNGVRAKPAAPVKVTDTVRIRVGDRERVVEVVQLIEHRVGAALAWSRPRGVRARSARGAGRAPHVIKKYLPGP